MYSNFRLRFFLLKKKMIESGQKITNEELNKGKVLKFLKENCLVQING